MRFKFFDFFVTGAILFCALSFSYNSAVAAVEVKAGEPDKIIFTVDTPVKAGEPFLAKIEIRDAYDNVLVNYHQMGKPIKLTWTGKGKLNPDVIIPAEFSEGIARVFLAYNKAEAITITANEQMSGKQGEAKVSVEPGKVCQFLVAAPASVAAGQNFPMKIEAYDACGNLVSDYSLKNKGVEVTVGTGKIFPNIIPASSFVNGIASVEAACYKVQRSAIYVMDIIDRAYGKSQIIKTEPSVVKRFLASIPVNAVAGEAFTVKIEAYDAFDNLVTNYDKMGRGILITPQGRGKINPNEIPASVFVNGVATVSFIYDKAEAIELLITEKPLQLPAVKSAEKTEKITEEAKTVKKEAAQQESEKVKEVAPAAEITDSRAEAKACYERAVKDISENKYEDAKKELEKCLVLDAGNNDAKKLLERLNNIIKLEKK